MTEGKLRVDALQSVVCAAQDLAEQMRIGFILRIQDKKEAMVNINNGVTEEIATTSLRGMGIQVFSADGYSGFASSDRVNPEEVRTLLRQAVRLADKVKEVAGEKNRAVFGLSPHRERRLLSLQHPYGSLSLNNIEERLIRMNKELSAIDPRLSVRTVFRVVDEEWRIARQDGTDTSFMTPRSFIYNSFAAKEGGKTATTYSNLPGSDLSILVNGDNTAKLMKKSVQAAQLALALLNAGTVKSGSYKLVIDYALAKGLAHEAFGHAAETDGMESSILGRDGRMRLGMEVAADFLSIIDGPVEGDYSYQPISANGLVRQEVRIVDRGRLQAGLADLFSAADAGVEVTGAGRVESCHHLPLARMTNIRIELDDYIAVDEDFEDITPEKLYQILLENELIQEGEEVLYLTGFQGGQVNPAFGNFVFNCSGIYKLGPKPILYRPAIFSGEILTALKSVRAGIGPLKIDAMGTCGKMMQGVPSSGGSHYFLLLDRNPEITIGGEAGE
ncbi:MAG TPA: TldD/PmbA family protein [Bacillota bacterium]